MVAVITTVIVAVPVSPLSITHLLILSSKSSMVVALSRREVALSLAAGSAFWPEWARLFSASAYIRDALMRTTWIVGGWGS